jgi:hypothetical protein
MSTAEEISNTIRFADMCIARDIGKDSFYRDSRHMVQ